MSSEILRTVDAYYSARVREQVNHTRGVDELVELLSRYLLELERLGESGFEAAAPADAADPSAREAGSGDLATSDAAG